MPCAEQTEGYILEGSKRLGIGLTNRYGRLRRSLLDVRLRVRHYPQDDTAKHVRETKVCHKHRCDISRR